MSIPSRDEIPNTPDEGSGTLEALIPGDPPDVGVGAPCPGLPGSRPGGTGVTVGGGPLAVTGVLPDDRRRQRILFVIENVPFQNSVHARVLSRERYRMRISLLQHLQIALLTAD